ncbi:DHH family phosphoesterase [Duganella qianjiadongensis]|uniref:DHH family phosphoesterase n=1 Tax=Duganella qianjiadongensis TaxID=2692176 RepID=UPI0019258C5F|nr:DHH family phosphoesterase [Duganella qianjiadongensis]
MNYDIFNGDADGICALHMLRLHAPASHQLITGVKRDIELLRKVPASASSALLVLDISLDTNAGELQRLLDGGARITWFDHHAAGCTALRKHSRLQLHCDTSHDVCTSILVDRHLQGRYRPWAVVGAFGDNLEVVAHMLARSLALPADVTSALQQLGQVLNYNAYGECISDLQIAPSDLYKAISLHQQPASFLQSALYHDLLDGYTSDCARLHNLQAHWRCQGNAVYLLPATPWARRISGVLANQLANSRSGNAYAVILERSDGDYLVSVRSPQPDSHSASQLCAEFPSGGGRKAAAGINRLPYADLERFIDRFSAYFRADTVSSHAS